ncbi:hypothetical protein C5167_037880, partial [Papaver somniferum]
AYGCVIDFTYRWCLRKCLKDQLKLQSAANDDTKQKGESRWSYCSVEAISGQLLGFETRGRAIVFSTVFSTVVCNFTSPGRCISLRRK